MSWIHAALASAAILAAVNIIDSHLVSRRFSGIRAFLLLLGGIHLVYGLVLAVVAPLSSDVGQVSLSLAIGSSVLRAGAVIILLDGLRHREVSSVIPVVYSYPVFVAVMAFFALGERLIWQQWLAIAVVASGAVLVAFNREPSRIPTGRLRPALILLAGALFAVADVWGKMALGRMSHWGLFWVSALVMGTIFLVVSARRGVVRQVLALGDRTRTLGFVLLNEAIAPVGMVISYWALARGPVSLVSTLLSTRPLFVLLFAFVLSRCAPGFLFWRGGRKLVALRVTATAMIVAGIAAIELS